MRCTFVTRFWRSLRAAAFGIVSVLLLTPMLAGVAHAQAGVAAGFEIDGNLKSDDAAHDDWFAGASGTGVLLGPPNCGSPNPARLPALFRRDGITDGPDSSFVGDAKNNYDISLGGPSNEHWVIGPLTVPSGKSNLTEVFAHSRVDINTGNLWLIMGAARLQTNGATNLDVEFNRAGLSLQQIAGETRVIGLGPANGRSMGDLLINIQYENGGNAPVANVLTWNGTEYVTPANPLPVGAVLTATNTAINAGSLPTLVPCPVTNTSANTSAAAYDSLQFVEVGINLDLAGIFPSQICGTHSTMTVKTRQSPSIDSQLADISITDFEIVQPPTLTTQVTNPQCNGALTGDIDLTVTPAGSYTYVWTGPNGFQETTEDIHNLAAGTYEVTVNNVDPHQACEVTATVEITQPDPLTLTLDSVDPKCHGDANGTITATGGGGTGTLTYSKDGTTFQGSNVFSGLAAGPYTITVKDANGCTKTADATLTDPAALTLSLDKVDPKCHGDANGTITATGGGGTGTLTYSKDGTTFQGSNVFSGLAAGPYTITVKDANGCTKTADATLTDPAALTLSLDKVDPKCHGDANGTITATGGGGTGTLTYSKDGTTFQGSNVFSGLAAGPYTITVKDANGCTKTADATLTDPAALTLSLDKVDPKCHGDANGTITATGGGGTGTLTYSKDGTTFQGSNVFSGLAAGPYTITVKDANGCTKTADATLTDPAALTLSLDTENPSCAGGNGKITATGGGGTGTLTYSKDGTTFQASNVFSGLSSGPYTITVKDANGCTKTADATLTDPAGLTLSLDSVDPKCHGDANGTITATGGGGTGALQYSKDGTTFQASGSFTGLAAGPYTITVKDANGCTKTADATLTDPAALTLSLDSVDPKCHGDANGTITATGGGGTGTLTYSKDGTTFQGSNVFSGLAAGPYTITVKDANGCTKTADATLTDPAALTLSLDKVDPKCHGDANGTITATGGGGTGTLTYSKDGTTFQGSNVFSGLAAGPYTITVKDANGCTKTADATLTDPAALTLSLDTENPSCAGGNGKITATASGGTGTLTYSKDGTTFQASNVFSGLSSGPYTITVKDANGCTKTADATLTDPAGLTLSLQSADPKCHGGASGSITATGGGGTGTLTYSKDGTTFQASNVFTGLAAGPYTITVKDANGCKTSKDATLTDPPALSLGLAHVDPTCAGNDGSITASASGGTGTLTYSKDGTTFQASNVFSGLGPGSYTITVKDANGCTKSADAKLNTPLCSVGGRVLPTGTTCDNFKCLLANGTNCGVADLTDICYNVRSGNINGPNPGVFFYYTSVKAPSSTFKVNIVQTASVAGYLLDVHQNQLLVYTPDCVRTQRNITLSSSGQGQISVSFTGATTGVTYVISVKYSVSSLAGRPVPPGGSVHYDFFTYIQGNPVPVDFDADGVNLTPCKNRASAYDEGGGTDATPDPVVELYRPSPNPFAGSMRFAYAVTGQGARVDIGVFDLAGRRIRGLVSGIQGAGQYTATWDGRDAGGAQVRNGVYFIRAVVGSQPKTMRIAFLP